MKLRISQAVTGIALVLAVAHTCQAFDANDSLKFNGYNSLEFGQVVRGENSRLGVPLNEVWQQLMRTGFSVNASVWDSRLTLNMNVQIKMWHGYPFYQRNPPTEDLYFNTFLPEANGVYKLGDTKNPYLSIGLGYFLYKYNPEARNLGEYLFRSTPYPQVLVSEFDFCYAQPLGLYLSSELFDHALKQDFFITTNVDQVPLYDFSLAYVCSYNIKNILELGAGVRFCSLLPMSDSLTTRKDHGSQNEYVSDNGDTSFYTFKGTVLMGRATFDPKGFFSSSIFGKEDLKIYSEVAVLGVENQYRLYNDISKRIPVMFGFNIPAFKFLEVLSLEMEWFGCPYPNDNYVQVLDNYPLPNVFTGGSNLDSAKINYYPHGTWKWSVYAKKTINRNLSIIGQVADDHMRIGCADWSQQDFEETLRKPGDWYWVLKLMVEI